ncbi:pentapeptide repeat-containing protein [Moorena sp. SIO4A5]|uniref:pentapeptide repeat-containing protein n=1 Tax=Moorena sp. SIO4A5 TaxID=2607838 RepID=UPI0013C77623|nr:pentapeptide repeat-containing protein [Moorena sp. SIO4A5]NEO19313.1 pentapeptide repeat-containing protein [Moorena sp. SIO4A5]
MKLPKDRIPEDQAHQVFALAAQLYAQHNQSYSVKELIEAGKEAQIPPEFMEKALAEIKKRTHSKSVLPKHHSHRSGLMLIGMGTVLLALAGIGWLANFVEPRPVPPPERLESIQLPEAGPTEVSVPEDQSTAFDDNLGSGHINKCTPLIEKDLRGANLRGADCTNVDLSGVDFTNANLTGANFSRADLSQANFSNANLTGADLAGADLANADLSGANLTDANLSNTDLTGSNLTGANLNGTDLAKADLEGSVINGANFDNTNLNQATMPNGTINQ